MHGSIHERQPCASSGPPFPGMDSLWFVQRFPNNGFGTLFVHWNAFLTIKPVFGSQAGVEEKVAHGHVTKDPITSVALLPGLLHNPPRGQATKGQVMTNTRALVVVHTSRVPLCHCGVVATKVFEMRQSTGFSTFLVYWSI